MLVAPGGDVSLDIVWCLIYVKPNFDIDSVRRGSGMDSQIDISVSAVFQINIC